MHELVRYIIYVFKLTTTSQYGRRTFAKAATIQRGIINTTRIYDDTRNTTTTIEV